MPTTVRRPVAAALRVALLLLAGAILFRWKIGPVVLSFDPPGHLLDGHGVHLGDPLALLPSWLAVPSGRVRLDRRVGVKAAVVPNPGRRESDRLEG